MLRKYKAQRKCLDSFKVNMSEKKKITYVSLMKRKRLQNVTIANVYKFLLNANTQLIPAFSIVLSFLKNIQ